MKGFRDKSIDNGGRKDKQLKIFLKYLSMSKPMKLGQGLQIVRGVPDVSTARTFYEALGFQIVEEVAHPIPSVAFTDGRMLFLLLQSESEYTGLIYYDSAIRDKIPELETLGIPMLSKYDQPDLPFQATFESPNKIPITLIEMEPTSAQIPQPNGDSIVSFGKFGELTLPVEDIDAMEKFWNQLGFTTILQMKDPYPLYLLTDGLLTIGLHLHPEIPAPAWTYFNLDMGGKIAQLQSLGYEIFEVMGLSVDSGNAAIRAPDGQFIFLFVGEV